MLTGAPNANDYLNLIRLRISDHVAVFRRSVAEIGGVAAKQGAANGSNYFLKLADALQSAFRPAATDVLRALPAVARQGALNRRELIEMTGPRLTEMLDSMIAITRLEQRATIIGYREFQEAISKRIAECRDIIPVLMRQTLIGYDTIWDEDVGTVNNTIHAGHITGPIQQGTSHSTQHSAINIDRARITHAIETLEENLADPANDEEMAGSIRSDIATINAQLGKQSPSPTILAEVGKSMRNIVEGIAGGALTPTVVSAVTALSSIL